MATTLKTRKVMVNGLGILALGGVVDVPEGNSVEDLVEVYGADEIARLAERQIAADLGNKAREKAKKDLIKEAAAARAAKA